MDCGVMPWDFGELTWPQLANILNEGRAGRRGSQWNMRLAREIAARTAKRMAGEAKSSTKAETPRG